jgi:hypothetical protein
MVPKETQFCPELLDPGLAVGTIGQMLMLLLRQFFADGRSEQIDLFKTDWSRDHR